MAAGEPLGITPYGTETMHVLRAEKGYPIIGQETDGTVTPQDLGMAWAVSTKKDFIGRRSHRRPDVIAAGPEAAGRPAARRPGGAAARGRPAGRPGRRPRLRPRCPMLGHVTSSYRSAALGRTFALALVKGGRDRIGRARRWRRWSTARSRRRSSTRSCSTRRTGGATGSRRHDGGRPARPLAARRRRRCPRASASCRSWPSSTCGPIPSDADLMDRLDRRPRGATADRAEHARSSPTTAPATSCGSARTSG